MSSPLIVDEEQIDIQDRVPPPRDRVALHNWATRTGKKKYQEQGDGIKLYISKAAEEKLRNHSIECSSKREEVMGFLLGEVFTHEDMSYTLVKDVVTTELEASSVKVRFKRDGFEKLFESLEESDFDYIIVGWYHSHPGHRCFMSSTDIETQKSIFNKEYHSALVIDPINEDIEAFIWEENEIEVRPFLVYWEESQEPYGVQA